MVYSTSDDIPSAVAAPTYFLNPAHTSSASNCTFVLRWPEPEVVSGITWYQVVDATNDEVVYNGTATDWATPKLLAAARVRALTRAGPGPLSSIANNSAEVESFLAGTPAAGTSDGESSSSKNIGVIFAVVTLICLAVLVATVMYLRNIRHSEPHKHPESVENYVSRVELPTSVVGLLENMCGDQPICTPRNIHSDNFKLVETMGSGYFGMVWKGTLDESDINDVPAYMVAVKILKENPDDKTEKRFHIEAAIMAQLKHKNVAKMIGQSTTDAGLFCILVQFCEHGNLLEHLEQFGPTLELDIMMNMLTDVADGMSYISSLGVVHRDLSARNILVSTDYSLKISDFGMAVILGEQDSYLSSDRMCYRWGAPEAFTRGVYSVASDVWSFAVVAFELFSLGQHPYADMTRRSEVQHYVLTGGRLPKPERCPDSIYSLMLQCWSTQPEQRPSFPWLLKRVSTRFGRLSFRASIRSGQIDVGWGHRREREREPSNQMDANGQASPEQEHQDGAGGSARNRRQSQQQRVRLPRHRSAAAGIQRNANQRQSLIGRAKNRLSMRLHSFRANKAPVIHESDNTYPLSNCLVDADDDAPVPPPRPPLPPPPRSTRSSTPGSSSDPRASIETASSASSAGSGGTRSTGPRHPLTAGPASPPTPRFANSSQASSPESVSYAHANESDHKLKHQSSLCSNISVADSVSSTTGSLLSAGSFDPSGSSRGHLHRHTPHVASGVLETIMDEGEEEEEEEEESEDEEKKVEGSAMTGRSSQDALASASVEREMGHIYVDSMHGQKQENNEDNDELGQDIQLVVPQGYQPMPSSSLELGLATADLLQAAGVQYVPVPVAQPSVDHTIVAIDDRDDEITPAPAGTASGYAADDIDDDEKGPPLQMQLSVQDPAGLVFGGMARLSASSSSTSTHRSSVATFRSSYSSHSSSSTNHRPSAMEFGQHGPPSAGLSVPTHVGPHGLRRGRARTHDGSVPRPNPEILVMSPGASDAAPYERNRKRSQSEGTQPERLTHFSSPPRKVSYVDLLGADDRVLSANDDITEAPPLHRASLIDREADGVSLGSGRSRESSRRHRRATAKSMRASTATTANDLLCNDASGEEDADGYFMPGWLDSASYVSETEYSSSMSVISSGSYLTLEIVGSRLDAFERCLDNESDRSNIAECFCLDVIPETMDPDELVDKIMSDTVSTRPIEPTGAADMEDDDEGQADDEEEVPLNEPVAGKRRRSRRTQSLSSTATDDELRNYLGEDRDFDHNLPNLLEEEEEEGEREEEATVDGFANGTSSSSSGSDPHQQDQEEDVASQTLLQQKQFEMEAEDGVGSRWSVDSACASEAEADRLRSSLTMLGYAGFRRLPSGLDQPQADGGSVSTTPATVRCSNSSTNSSIVPGRMDGINGATPGPEDDDIAEPYPVPASNVLEHPIQLMNGTSQPAAVIPDSASTYPAALGANTPQPQKSTTEKAPKGSEPNLTDSNMSFMSSGYFSIVRSAEALRLREAREQCVEEEPQAGNEVHNGDAADAEMADEGDEQANRRRLTLRKIINLGEAAAHWDEEDEGHECNV